MSYVEIDELRRVFTGDVVALDGIQVSLESGEFLTLLGPSGCGKTTALRLVAGFDRPTSGRVRVCMALPVVPRAMSADTSCGTS